MKRNRLKKLIVPHFCDGSDTCTFATCGLMPSYRHFVERNDNEVMS